MSSLFAYKLDNSTAMLPTNGASNQANNGVQL